MMEKNIIKEACVVNYTQAKKALEFGANRLELCFDMANDGITPSYGTAKQIKENINIPVFCRCFIIFKRPRKDLNNPRIISTN